MASNNTLHVVLFPWLAFGNIIPFLQLSKFIAEKGHKVSFVSTTRNIERLPKVLGDLKYDITLVQLTLPRVIGLAENAEATIDLRIDEAQYLKKAFDGLENELTRFLESSTPDWIIYDFAPHWLPHVAAKLGISTAFFSLFNAWFLGFICPSDGSDKRITSEDYTVPPEWVPFKNSVAFRLYEANKYINSSLENLSGYSDRFRVESVIMGSDIVIVRQCLELEPEWINLVENLYCKPVKLAGLMPPLIPDDVDDKETWFSTVEWLDKHEKESVVYVSLGSETILSQLELTELAIGLELSGKPFFWALRKPPHLTESDSFELPEGFTERIKERGLVCMSWAPQMKILSHDSVGGFLTHCGWNSMIEGLRFGKPLIMLGFWIDQGLNARIFADKKVGTEVPRNEENGSFTRNSVADSVISVMEENGGASYKQKAKELSKVFGNCNLQYNYIDELIQYLEEKKK